ncbi:MAG: zinc-binding dehydrogenase, partial [Actinobacteria bacterium]
EDFTQGEHRYDLMLDIVGGGRSWSDCKRVLSPKATVVVVGGPLPNRWTGLSLRQLVRLRLASSTGDRNVVTPFLAKLNRDDLVVLRDLLEAGRVTPVIDRRYELSEVPDALRYLGEGHARGKVVISV